MNKPTYKQITAQDQLVPLVPRPANMNRDTTSWFVYAYQEPDWRRCTILYWINHSTEEVVEYYDNVYKCVIDPEQPAKHLDSYKRIQELLAQMT
jgi:hypothetical protein